MKAKIESIRSRIQSANLGFSILTMEERYGESRSSKTRTLGLEIVHEPCRKNEYKGTQLSYSCQSVSAEMKAKLRADAASVSRSPRLLMVRRMEEKEGKESAVMAEGKRTEGVEVWREGVGGVDGRKFEAEMVVMKVCIGLFWSRADDQRQDADNRAGKSDSSSSRREGACNPGHYPPEFSESLKTGLQKKTFLELRLCPLSRVS